MHAGAGVAIRRRRAVKSTGSVRAGNTVGATHAAVQRVLQLLVLAKLIASVIVPALVLPAVPDLPNLP